MPAFKKGILCVFFILLTILSFFGYTGSLGRINGNSIIALSWLIALVLSFIAFIVSALWPEKHQEKASSEPGTKSQNQQISPSEDIKPKQYIPIWKNSYFIASPVIILFSSLVIKWGELMSWDRYGDGGLALIFIAVIQIILFIPLFLFSFGANKSIVLKIFWWILLVIILLIAVLIILARISTN